jgi:hypothetical protein
MNPSFDDGGNQLGTILRVPEPRSTGALRICTDGAGPKEAMSAMDDMGAPGHHWSVICAENRVGSARLTAWTPCHGQGP